MNRMSATWGKESVCIIKRHNIMPVFKGLAEQSFFLKSKNDLSEEVVDLTVEKRTLVFAFLLSHLGSKRMLILSVT